jgi:glycerophosphoryl diester phosphodiesterase
MRASALGVVLALLAASPAAAKAPAIHAHRGGPVLAGVPTYPEETMPAFRNAAREGYWLELDAKLTEDRVPVVFHDARLDRMTPCTGDVRERTLKELAECKTDVLGSPGSGLPTKEVEPSEPIPTLAEVLAFARDEGAFVNLEIKNAPTDADFDSTPAFANRVMDVVVKSGFPEGRLIVQSFWPDNLTVAKQRLPGVETAFLTLGPTNDGGPAFAASSGFEWVSPQWPVDAEYVGNARGLGRFIVPYTLNIEQDVRDAAVLGVDALITDDPLMAQGSLGLTRAALLPDRLRPSATLDAPAYASERSRDARFPLPLSGEDRGSGIDGFRLEVRRSVTVSDRWRLVSDGARSQAQFRGRPGVTYLFRLRARDRVGNRSSYDYGETVVPLDDRARVLRLDAGWKRIRAGRAWGKTLTRARRAGAVARARVSGERVALIARRGRRAGRLLVTLDGKPRKVVSLRGRPRHRQIVFRSRVLPPGAHKLELTTLGGGPVDLDAIGIDQGPPPPR